MSFLEPGAQCRFSSGGWCWAHASLKCRRQWEPITTYRVGDRVWHDGIEYEVICPDCGQDCTGADFRSGYIAPPECIEDGVDYYLALTPDENAVSVVTRKHTQECSDNALIHHAATGGDTECICT